MRYASRISRLGVTSDLLTSQDEHLTNDDAPGLSAFRGLLVALSFSALFWAACITAVWLLFVKS
jgi:hypothetical protein